MDPEIQRDYEEHMRTMVDLLNQQATATSKLLNSLQSTSKATEAVKSNTEATKKQTEVMSGSTKALEAGAIAQQKYAEAAANFSRGLISGKAAVMSFGNALLNTEKSIGKYGNAFQSAGDAAWDIGKNFGILGMAAGGLAKGFGAIAEGVFKSLDSVIQFRDETSRFAGILPTTLSGIQELGSNARFSGEEIMKLSKTMSGFGRNILSLGGSAGEGALKFMQMSAVTDDVRRKFGRLGVDQDRLNEMQGMYIQLQGISGKALENRTKTEGQLQRESLAYAKNLIIMSDLTGETAEEMQREREVAKAEFEEQVKIRQENLQIQRLIQAEDYAGAAAIKKEQDNRTALITMMTDAYDAETGQMFGRMARTGVYDDFTKGLGTLGVSASQVADMVKNSNNIATDSLNQVQNFTERQSAMVESAGSTLQFVGEEYARNLGLTNATITQGNNYLGRNFRESYEQAQRAMAAKEAEGDAVADAAEQLRSVEREIQKLYYDSMFALAEIVVPKFAGALEWGTQQIMRMINYLSDNFDIIVAKISKYAPVLATAAGIAVGALLTLKIGRGVASIFTGIIGAGRGLISWMRRVTSTPMGGGPGGGPDVDGPDGDRDRRGSRGGRLLRFGRGLLGGLGGLLGGLALDYGAEKAAEAGYTRTAAAASTGSAALYGAGMGATLGSIVPGLGTVAGGAIGGLLGGAYGMYQNWGGLTGANDPAQQALDERARAATERQAEAAATSQTASEGMSAASEEFRTAAANFAETNEQSYERITAAIAEGRGETPEETEARTETVRENTETVSGNTRTVADSTAQTVTDIEQRRTLARTSQEQMRQQTALFKKFTDTVESATLVLKTFKDSMQNLVNQIGTSLLQIVAPTGGGADTPMTIDSFLAMIAKLESGDGKYLRPLGLGNTGTIGGRYHMEDRARIDAFNEMTPEERAEMARLGFTAAPTLRQLVRGDGEQATFVSQNAEQADRLLGRAGARLAMRNLQRIHGRAGTHLEGRNIWHQGPGGYRTYNTALTSNPNMRMADISSIDDDRQYANRTVREQNEYMRGEVNRAMGATGTGLYANADLTTPDARRIIAIATALRNRGYTVSGHPHYEQTVGHSDKSRHYLGLALDINKGDYSMAEMEQHKDEFDALDAELTRQGFGVLWNESGHMDHLHLQLAKGGIVSGPASGYPATLHGTEVVTPLNMDSILMRLAKTPAAADGADGMLNSNITREALDRMSFAQKEMIDVLTRKLDNVIDALDDGNSTRTRILRNSMV